MVAGRRPDRSSRRLHPRGSPLLTRYRRLALVGAIALVVAACGATGPRRAAIDAPGEIPDFGSPAERIEVRFDLLVSDVEIATVVVAEASSVVAAPVDGSVTTILVKPGDAVTAGDPLVVFAPTIPEADRLRIEILDREIRLAELGGDVELQSTLQEERSAFAEAVGAEVTLMAPIDGIAQRPDAPTGSSVAVGEAVIGIATGEGSELRGTFSSPFASYVAVGQLAVADLGAGEFASGSIDEVVESGDGIEIVASVDADGLAIGRRVTLLVAVDFGRRLLVPVTALNGSPSDPFVIRETAEGTERVSVSVGFVFDDRVELYGDLRPGDVVLG